jgi:outer membrane receptor protein involved in Fe transport
MAAYYNYYLGNSKVIGMAENIVANDDIKWETTAITDLGFDAAFWKGRINVTFDYFNKITSDILLQLSMPTTFLGTLGAPYQNAGKVRNRGWELAVNYNDHKGDWNWQAAFNLSAVKNRIIDNKGIDTYSGEAINREGNPIGSYYGLKAIGIYRAEEDLNRTNSQGVVIT